MFSATSPSNHWGRIQKQAFFSVSALLFAAGTALTVYWCASMSAMGGMTMPPRTWSGTATSFVGMWVAMTISMMLPSLVPMLGRYRASVLGTGKRSIDRLTALVALGYFSVWIVVGTAAFALGSALAEIELQFAVLARAVPIAAGVVVLLAGALQFTAWKAHHLACCRTAPRHRGMLAADAGKAWRYGLYLGLHCSYCCAGLTAILLVNGVMDLKAMAAVTVAITWERLAPRAERIARAIGVVALIAGILLLARAGGLR